MTEADEQAIFCRWLRARGILHFSVPNEGKRSVRLAARMRAMGLTPGVADLIIVRNPTLAIELKAAHRFKERNGGLSPAQVAWQLAARANGWVVITAYGAKDAIKQTQQILALRPGTV